MKSSAINDPAIMQAIGSDNDLQRLVIVMLLCHNGHDLFVRNTIPHVYGVHLARIVGWERAREAVGRGWVRGARGRGIGEVR